MRKLGVSFKKIANIANWKEAITGLERKISTQKFKHILQTNILDTQIYHVKFSSYLISLKNQNVDLFRAYPSIIVLKKKSPFFLSSKYHSVSDFMGVIFFFLFYLI